MRKLKILVSSICLFGIYSFVNVSAMEQNIENAVGINLNSQEFLQDEDAVFDFYNKKILFSLTGKNTYHEEIFEQQLLEKYKDDKIFNVDIKSKNIEDLIKDLYKKVFYDDGYFKKQIKGKINPSIINLFNPNNIKNISFSDSENVEFEINFESVSCLSTFQAQFLQSTMKNDFVIKSIRGFLGFIQKKLKLGKIKNKILDEDVIFNPNNREFIFSLTGKNTYHDKNLEQKLLNKYKDISEFIVKDEGYVWHLIKGLYEDCFYNFEEKNDNQHNQGNKNILNFVPKFMGDGKLINFFHPNNIETISFAAPYYDKFVFKFKSLDALGEYSQILQSEIKHNSLIKAIRAFLGFVKQKFENCGLKNFHYHKIP